MLTETILLEQNRRLREENDELRETVRQLRLQPAGLAPLPECIPYLTPYEERILRALLATPGTLTKEGAYQALYPTSAERDPQIVLVIVHRLRKKLVGTSFKIETVWGRGYHLVRPAVPPAAAVVSEAA